MNPIRLFAAPVLLLFSSLLQAQAPTVLKAAGLQQDVDILERAYTQLHPGLYRYNTPAQMQAHFAELRKQLDHDQSVAEAYLAFSRFAGTVRCGHTYANFYNQKEPVVTEVLQSPTRVPFHFRWLQGKMIVSRNFSGDASLVPGTEVLAINGIRAADILAAMLPLARADGSNDGKRASLLEVAGVDRYESFDVYLPLLFPQIGAQQVLSVRSPGDAQPRELSVAAQTYAQRLAQREALAKGEADANEGWTLRFTDEGIAVMTLPNWALYDSKFDWKAWLAQSFGEIEKRHSRGLVIDIRENEGGLSVGDVLLAHLVDKPLDLPGYVRKTRYRSTPEDLRPYLDTWDKSFNDWGKDVTDLGDGFFRLQREGEQAEGDRIAPIAPRYTGKVIVLVSATNSSAAFEFAFAAKQAGLARLLGETTGGNRRGINGGAFFFLRLPNSKIELDLPLVGQFPSTPQPDAGLEPDLPVPTSAADLAAGRDAQMDSALALLAAD